MKILLVEPYCGGSHEAWATGYARASGHDVVLVSHPGRAWRWRMTGGALTLAAAIQDEVARGGAPDVALISGMVHLPALLGLARPALDRVPVALYLHENQLTYPLDPDASEPERKRDRHGHGLTNWMSMAAADLVLVNSEHHRSSLAHALPRLLERAPDLAHSRWLDAVLSRTSVLPVGIDLRRLDSLARSRSGSPLVLWCARWEHDKQPHLFAAAIDRLAVTGADFRLALCGERLSGDPALDGLVRRHASRVAHSGYAEEGEYGRLLTETTVVVSTAAHEFFGVAVVEAVYAGAFPVLPQGLSYPELLPAAVHQACLYEDEAGLDERLAWAVSDTQGAAEIAAQIRPELERYDWSAMAPRYDAVLEELAGSGSRGRLPRR